MSVDITCLSSGETTLSGWLMSPEAATVQSLSSTDGCRVHCSMPRSRSAATPRRHFEATRHHVVERPALSAVAPLSGTAPSSWPSNASRGCGSSGVATLEGSPHGCDENEALRDEPPELDGVGGRARWTEEDLEDCAGEAMRVDLGEPAREPGARAVILPARGLNRRDTHGEAEAHGGWRLCNVRLAREMSSESSTDRSPSSSLAEIPLATATSPSISTVLTLNSNLGSRASSDRSSFVTAWGPGVQEHGVARAVAPGHTVAVGYKSMGIGTGTDSLGA